MEEKNSSVEERSSATPDAKPSGHSKVRTFFSIVSTILIAGLLIWAVVSFMRHYDSEDHSVYGNLNNVTYSANGLHFSFDYPSVMKKDSSMAAKLPSAPLAYTYYVNQSLQAVIAVSHEAIGSNLKILDLSPSQYISQIRNGTGSYFNAMNSMYNIKDSAKADFPGCTQSVITKSGQTTVLCVNNPSDYTNARVIGATDTTQYTLEMIMKPAVWNAHQSVWKKIESSFSFQ